MLLPSRGQRRVKSCSSASIAWCSPRVSSAGQRGCHSTSDLSRDSNKGALHRQGSQGAQATSRQSTGRSASCCAGLAAASRHRGLERRLIRDIHRLHQRAGEVPSQASLETCSKQNPFSTETKIGANASFLGPGFLPWSETIWLCISLGRPSAMRHL